MVSKLLLCLVPVVVFGEPRIKGWTLVNANKDEDLRTVFVRLLLPSLR